MFDLEIKKFRNFGFQCQTNYAKVYQKQKYKETLFFQNDLILNYK